MPIDLGDLQQVQFWQKVANENLAYGRFESTPGYRESSDSPFVVVPQTSTVLDMYLDGRIFNPDPANQFLKEATFPYLARAKKGLEVVSAVSGDSKFVNWTEVAQSVVDPDDTENIEALGYMLVVFVHMPELPSRVLPKGFSRRGNLRPPATIAQFFSRIDELRASVFKISQRNETSDVPLEGMRPALMRTLAFFRTGSWLPFKFPDDIRDDTQKEHVVLSRLIGDLNIDL